MYKHVLCFPDKEFSANYPIILKALFSTDFDIYIKRYSFYVYDSLNRELSKLVKVIHLSLNQAFSEKTSEMGNEEILFSEYVTKSEKKSLQEENLFSNMQ